MEWIKNLKIAQKLNLLLVLASIIALAIGLTGYLFVQKGAKDMTSLYEDILLPVAWFSSIKTNANQIQSDLLKLMLTTDKNRKMELIDDIKTRRGLNNELFKKYEATKLDSYEIENIAKYKLAMQKWRDVQKVVIDLSKANKNDQANKYYTINENAVMELDSVIKKLADHNEEVAGEINTQNDKDALMTNIVLLVTIFGGLGLLISLGLMVSTMITRPIKNAIDGLNVGTEEVSSAASQVSAASQSLAEGTSEQAAAIQETSATLEETSSMVHQNRENTQQAAVLAKQAKQYAEKSNDEMHKMSQSMSELKNSSSEIAKIIKVIDEIAFQTNILSLNAAVEAARAGDAGKGFAVVAEEVRNLAQRSAQAAKDTTVIIESNIDLSESSVNIAKAVRESVESIGEQATKVSDLLDEISVATNEQAQGVEQIHKAVSQMEMALQSNAATADESAAASMSLSEQAVNVKEIVNTLIVLVDGADALRGQSHRMALSVNPPRQISSGPSRRNPQIASNKQSPENIIPLNDF